MHAAADCLPCPCLAATRAQTVGYGRHLLASAPAPATTKSTTVGYGRRLMAMAPAYAPAPGPGLTKSEFLPFGRHLLASAPAPASAPSLSGPPSLRRLCVHCMLATDHEGASHALHRTMRVHRMLARGREPPS